MHTDVYVLTQRRSGHVGLKSAGHPFFLAGVNLDCVKKPYVTRGYKVSLQKGIILSQCWDSFPALA